ncbi:MAG: selenide, water dikinase SelD [Planctomycetota bacterium]
MNTKLASKTVVLLGVGHTNAHVLRMWRMHRPAGTRLMCVSNFRTATYSGMLPGTLAGLLPRRAMEIDLVRLCKSAGATLICNDVVGCDPARQELLFEDRPALPFDVLSVGIGSEPDMSFVRDGAAGVVPIKPMQTFLDRLAVAARVAVRRAAGRPLRVAVLGGGAAGVEITFCLPGWFAAEHPGVEIEQTLIDGSGIGRGLSDAAQGKVLAELERRGVRLEVGRRVAAVEPGAAVFEDGVRVEFDLLVLGTSARAPTLLGRLGLPTDERGFLLTDDTLRSTSGEPAFAVGDSGSIQWGDVPKAGVYAVRQGPVLWENVRRLLKGRQLERYRPQRGFLKLLNTGDGRAIADYRGRSAHAGWCWRWKQHVDGKFMRMYQDYSLPRMSPPKPTADEPMRCVGCGGKVGGRVLERVLGRLGVSAGGGAVEVGLGAADDAAVVRLGGGRAVATVDFFAPPLDDLYIVGRVAALNALSDAFAMNARPVAALASVTLPEGAETAQEHALYELLTGGVRELRAAGAELAGGHTIEGPRFTVGYTVLAEPRDEGLFTKGGLRPGQTLVLTKPLGSGVLFAAQGRAECRAEWMESLLDAMLRSNGPAVGMLAECGVTAATDVTGFGLAGHMLEMLRASGVSAEIDLGALPLLPGAAELFVRGEESSMAAANRGVEAAIDATPKQRAVPECAALFDPQTAGGLLFGVDVERAGDVVGLLRGEGYADAAVIGTVRKSAEEPLGSRIDCLGATG